MSRCPVSIVSFEKASIGSTTDLISPASEQDWILTHPTGQRADNALLPLSFVGNRVRSCL